MKNPVFLALFAACAALSAALAPCARAATLTVTKAQQRQPWNGMVDIAYTAGGLAEEGVIYETPPELALKVWAVDASGRTNVAEAAYLSGDTTPADGTHGFVWDMGGQGAFPNLVADLTFFVSVEVTKEGVASAVQLWENGPYFATKNVGAEKPQDYGYYFWWGDTVGYRHDGSKWVSVDGKGSTITFSKSDATAASTYNKDNAALKSGGWIDDSGDLVVSDDAAKNHDAARAHWGSPWRMMTDAELQALIANTKTTWTDNWNGTGVAGRIVTGKGDYDKNSIFLPAAGYGYNSSLSSTANGYYWSSTPYSAYPESAWDLHFDSGNVDRFCYYRYIGYTVRPVRNTK